ncbi:SIMPL domain-containing protein [Flavisolibacter ginsengisoli]|uniref:SIMPL domain-containing protein n=1 Tax=Flavisolibacter ginsengisoli DSM 18119 TaxID=1121884 RepID=A0A1M5EFB9_9BACT|nr:SIMPL domain-containing protein [Flavisolibacter ginsengisoli]SHF77925.1 hypothetical protein SAMN02745131_03505 [Flavisolibacter ginsengisoli DSM 18119]
MTKICMFLVCLITSFISQAQAKNFIDQPYLEVTGSADTLIEPDEIYINIIISEKDNRDRIPVEEQETRMLASFKEIGIDIENNLSVNYMGSNFKYILLKGKEVIKTRQYVLKVKDARTAAQVFLLLEQLDISNSSIQKVNYSAINSLRNIMRNKAVANARERAIALTSALQQNVGNAIYLVDIDNNNLANQLYGSQLQDVVVTGYTVKLKGLTQGSNPGVEFEKIKVSALVGAKFLLK